VGCGPETGTGPDTSRIEEDRRPARGS
jgi:hypothetical protein